MNKNDDINEYLPSILNPRGIKKQPGNLTLTQNSIVSRCSLSLKRVNKLASVKKALHKIFPFGKENVQFNNCVFNNVTLPINRKNVGKNSTPNADTLTFSLTPEVQLVATGKENSQNAINCINNKVLQKQNVVDEASIGFSAVEDLNTERRKNNPSPFSFEELEPVFENNIPDDNNNDKTTLLAQSSDTELEDHQLEETKSTIDNKVEENPVISVSFGISDCETIQLNVSTNNKLSNIIVSHRNNAMNVDCDIQENSQTTEQIDDVIEISSEDESPPKKRANVAVNLEIKKRTSTVDPTENTKVLILNTDAVEKLTHVIVQPPNYKLVKRKIPNKFKNRSELVSNGRVVGGLKLSLKQKKIDSYFVNSRCVVDGKVCVRSARDEVMSKVPGGVEAVKCERGPQAAHKSGRRERAGSPRLRPFHNASPRQNVKGTTSDQRNAQRTRDSMSSSASPRKPTDPTIAPKTSNRNSPTPGQHKSIPCHKLIAGTHFAVDAFSYGDIPNVQCYFLTHFHSDHYSGLKKSFHNTLFCSKITAELCITRLGVSGKYIQILNFDEVVTIDGIDVLAVDANHCPGALMLVFTLPSGKTLLHTGDFRAAPHMESYPIFWNRDVHTVYLDSTYCNPRYDFPTQEQCLEMALYLLRQKKMALEKLGKKFSSVLIVCGTYTIGKEKFFMGMARRVGCNVWACPEKDKVLQAVEGRSFNTHPPTACQLHVVPMRDLTHEKLRSYLETLAGSFSEVVAFKPSGWENGKNSSVEKDSVTIHGIPYSEHSSFSEMIRFIKFLQPKLVIPTVDISGGIKSVQKYFPCPLVNKDEIHTQSKVTDYYSIQHQHHAPPPAVT